MGRVEGKQPPKWSGSQGSSGGRVQQEAVAKANWRCLKTLSVVGVVGTARVGRGPCTGLLELQVKVMPIFDLIRKSLQVPSQALG